MEPLPEDYYTRPVNLTEGNFIHDSTWFMLTTHSTFVTLMPCDLRFLNSIVVKSKINLRK